MSYPLKSKSKRYQSLQKLITAMMIVTCIGVTPQLAADFSFFDQASDILTQLETKNPKLKNNLIDTERSRQREKPRARIRFSLDQAASRARSQSGGRVIKAQTRWSNGQPIHIIRVLSDDRRVKTYRYDGVTGRRL